jgi:hypothetical protein
LFVLIETEPHTEELCDVRSFIEQLQQLLEDRFGHLKASIVHLVAGVPAQSIGTIFRSASGWW